MTDPMLTFLRSLPEPDDAMLAVLEAKGEPVPTDEIEVIDDEEWERG